MLYSRCFRFTGLPSKVGKAAEMLLAEDDGKFAVIWFSYLLSVDATP